MEQKTPLYEEHVAAGARMVPFAGWLMPLSYGSDLSEHRAVRDDSGLFDVAHMGIVDITGPDAKRYLRYVLANDIDRLPTAGRAQYGVMCNLKGGIVDDLITYYLGDRRYRIVLNASRRQIDLNWLREHAQGRDVSIVQRDDLALLAVQGPRARERAIVALPESVRGEVTDLKPFCCSERGDWVVARTGYTGEDGWEIMLKADRAPGLWRKLIACGIKPAGLAARDSLRLEAGLNLYGQDMDEKTNPYESNLGWTVTLEPEDRDFVGRAALEAALKAGVKRKLCGLLLRSRGVLRHGQLVSTPTGQGVVTSGGFSPNLERSIALARLPQDAGGVVRVSVRNKTLEAIVVSPPFVRHGKARVTLD